VLKRSFLVLITSVCMFSAALALADEKTDIANIKETFSKVLPGSNPESIKQSVLPGVYEVVYGAQILYMSGDGKYVIQGDLIDLAKRENLTESTRKINRAKLVKNIKDGTTVIFEPKEVKHTITVFTDIDCGYCRKLHREMQDYLDAGIRVRYLAYPRSGVNTDSYYKAVTVWCSGDKNDAMTESKAGTKLPRKDCVNPVEEHMKMADQFGVTGTPTIVFENGEVVPGYVPAERLTKILDDAKKATKG